MSRRIQAEAIPRTTRGTSRLVKWGGAIMMATIVGLIARDITEPAAMPLWRTVTAMAIEKFSPSHEAKPVALGNGAAHYSAADRAALTDLIRRTSR
jgi:hypothetical protein